MTDDADLRAYCLFGDVGLAPSVTWHVLPQDVQEEWDDEVERLDGLPAYEARVRMQEASWRLHERFAVRRGPDDPFAPSGDIGLRLGVQAMRARRAGARCTLTRREWEALDKAFNGRCAYCARPGRTIDHVIPISQGGAHALDNVVPACWPCNLSKRALDVVDWLEQRARPVSEILDRIAEL